MWLGEVLELLECPTSSRDKAGWTAWLSSASLEYVLDPEQEIYPISPIEILTGGIKR